MLSLHVLLRASMRAGALFDNRFIAPGGLHFSHFVLLLGIIDLTWPVVRFELD